MLKTIACTFGRKHRSAKSTPSAYYAPASRSVAQSWSMSQSQNLGAPTCSLWSLESSLMERTTVMSFLCRECRQQSSACRENCSVSSIFSLLVVNNQSNSAAVIPATAKEQDLVTSSHLLESKFHSRFAIQIFRKIGRIL